MAREYMGDDLADVVDAGGEGRAKSRRIKKPERDSGSNYYRRRTFRDISEHFGSVSRSAFEPK